MSKLTIVASFNVVDESKIEVLKPALANMVAATREEDGCLQYDLHQDNDDPTSFMFYENWASREQWLAHMETEHVKAYRAVSAGNVENFKLSEMTHIM